MGAMGVRNFVVSDPPCSLLVPRVRNTVQGYLGSATGSIGSGFLGMQEWQFNRCNAGMIDGLRSELPGVTIAHINEAEVLRSVQAALTEAEFSSTGPGAFWQDQLHPGQKGHGHLA